jgi:excisionase family DNA binding protein
MSGHNNPEPTFATILEVAAAWQCSESTVRRLAQSGEIPSIKIGRLLRFPRELIARVVATDFDGPTCDRGGRVALKRG